MINGHPKRQTSNQETNMQYQEYTKSMIITPLKNLHMSIGIVLSEINEYLTEEGVHVGKFREQWTHYTECYSQHCN